MRPERDAPVPVLVLSTVYPSSAQPWHGLFVRERVRSLPSRFATRVIAPVPWFPFSHELRPGLRPRVPSAELDRDTWVEHPRFPSVPAILKCLDAAALFASLLPRLARLRRQFPFAVIDAHFAYPEGTAAVWLGRALGVPVCLTLRGTLPLVAAHRLRRPQAVHALRRAGRLVAVSDSLRRVAEDLGAPAGKVRVIRNGVDLDRFRLQERDSCRRRLGLSEADPLVVSVGHLSARKGFDLLITALSQLRERWPRVQLAVVGGPGAEGFVLAELESLAAAHGIGNRVLFVGARGGDELAAWYGAADVFALASAHEGCPNVILEALACGTPVVTTAVGDAAELVEPGRTGLVAERRSADALAATLTAALSRPWDREACRRSPAVRPWALVGQEVGQELMAAIRGSDALAEVREAAA